MHKFWWKTLIREVDPDFDTASKKPVVYQFSGGRRFTEQKDGPYTNFPKDEGDNG